MKKLIAYSSVAHMGFVTMGIFTMTRQGIDGALFQMISHGLVSGALFLCVGVVYDRMHTREIAAYGGLVNRMPLYAFTFMVFTMANVGLPGTSRFRRRVSDPRWRLPEQHLGCLLRHDRRHPVGGYALWLYRRVVFGKLEKASLAHIADMTPREAATLAPLVVLTILFGVYPGAAPRCLRRLGRKSDGRRSEVARCGGRNPSRGAANECRCSILQIQAMPRRSCRRSFLVIAAMALLMFGVFRESVPTTSSISRRSPSSALLPSW